MERLIPTGVLLAQFRLGGIVLLCCTVVLLMRLAARRLRSEVLAASILYLHPLQCCCSQRRGPRWQAGSPARPACMSWEDRCRWHRARE